MSIFSSKEVTQENDTGLSGNQDSNLGTLASRASEDDLAPPLPEIKSPFISERAVSIL